MFAEEVNTIKVSTKEKFTCLTCKKLFSTVSNLNQHMQIHSNEKPYICNRCQRSYGRNSTLTRHMKTCHINEPSTLKCDESSQILSNNNTQPEEMMNIDENIACPTPNGKDNTCNLCQMQFTRKYNLSRHLSIHKGEKRIKFKCFHCDSVFTRKDNLKYHSRLHKIQL